MKKAHVKSTRPLQIRVGVTGHRSLKDLEELKDLIKEILSTRYLEVFDSDARESILSSQGTPIDFTVISPLAEGADRLVAKTAMEYHNARLEVVIPFAVDEYTEEFSSLESRNEFWELLGKAHRRIELGAGLRVSADEVGRRANNMNGYHDVGRYIVEHSDLLIALWDGQPARGKGGTADVIAYAASREKPVFIISTERPYGISLRNGGILHLPEG